MSFLELTGMVGAGKSTIAFALGSHLEQAGWRVFTPVIASRHCLDRSWLGRMVRRFLPGGWSRGRNALLRYLISPLYQLLFALKHPRLIGIVGHSQLRRPLSWSHRRLILKRFADVAGHYQFLGSRLQPDELVIFEEGLVHRAINLFAWAEGPLEGEQLLAYFRCLPAMDWLVVVEAPPTICQLRAQKRGLPAHLADKDKATVDRFSQHSAQIMQLALVAAAGQRQVIQIDNSHTLAESLHTLQTRLMPAFLELSLPQRG